MSRVIPIRRCPGVKSPFGPHTFRPCTHECGRYAWSAEGVTPAMRLNLETGRRECPNKIPVAT